MSEAELPPPRLLVVADTLAGGLGGAAVRHVEEMTFRGWIAALAAPSAEEAVMAFNLPVPASGRDLPEMERSRRMLQRLIRTFRPQMLHCHGIRSFMVARLAFRGPVMVTQHGAGQLPEERAWYFGFRKALTGLVPRLAAHAFSVTPETGPGWEFLPHASPRLAGLRAADWSTADNVPRFAWVGRLSEQKRCDIFVRAMAALARERPVTGVVCGDGPLRPSLEALAGELTAPIEFLGEVEDVGAEIRRAWAVVLLSRFEGVPFALQETAWMGRSAVVTPLPGPAWIMGNAGVYARTVEDTVTAMRRLCDPAEAAKLGLAAGAHVRQLLSPDAPWDEIARRSSNLLSKS